MKFFGRLLSLALVLLGISGCSGFFGARKIASVDCQADYSAMNDAQLSACLGISVEHKNNDVFVSDSLVGNLSCRDLTKDNVFSRLDPLAFYRHRHMPIENFDMKHRLSGQCWAMALAQRRIFYLGRFRARGLSDTQLQESLEEFRSTMKISKGYRHFYVPEEDFLDAGVFKKEMLSDHFSKRLAQEQSQRFFNPLNDPISRIKMISGNRERRPQTNEKTFRRLQDSLARGELPIIDIRVNISAQHVLVLKAVEERSPGLFVFRVYDSNAPLFDSEVAYRADERQFYAPQVLKDFGADESKVPIGVFFIEAREMQNIREASYNYYSGLCSHIQNTTNR